LLGADLVDDDDLGHVVLDGLDHDGVLQRRSGDLHAARAADPGVWDVAVAGDLVRGVDDDDALPHLVREHARDLAQKCRLPDAGATEEQNAAPGLARSGRISSRPVKRASGRRPRSITISSRLSSPSRPRTRWTSSGGRACRMASSSSVASNCSLVMPSTVEAGGHAYKL